jgi:hypothetical protein
MLKRSQRFLFILIAIIFFYGIVGFTVNDLFSQTISNQGLQEGVQLFYQANFEEAIKVLNNTIESENLSQSDLFLSYVFLSFALIRGRADLDLANYNFQKAVKTAPKNRLDPQKIPPDLFRNFEEIRQGLLGSLFIDSNPRSAYISVYRDGRKILQDITPVQMNQLITGRYVILISKESFEHQQLITEVTHSKINTLRVTLNKLKKPFYRKTWFLAVGSSAILTSVYAIISSSSSKSTRSADLPTPPKHP